MFGGQQLRADLGAGASAASRMRHGPAHLPQRAVQRREDPQALLPVPEQPLHVLEAPATSRAREGVAQQVERLAQAPAEHRGHVVRA